MSETPDYFTRSANAMNEEKVKEAAWRVQKTFALLTSAEVKHKHLYKMLSAASDTVSKAREAHSIAVNELVDVSRGVRWDADTDSFVASDAEK